MKLCDKESCVGCMACKNICPKKAIKVGHDKMLKTIPVINTDLCVNCGLCTSVCPVLQESKYREPIHCYAAWTKNAEDQKNCTSGGIATALSRKLMQDGGKVFGCTYNGNLDLEIKVADTEAELEYFKGSKYVQSSTSDSYRETQRILKEGKKVLYVGTPCQIDGLLHFLKKDYDNLFTIDIICHGVPPLEYLKKYVKELHVLDKATSVSFRGAHDYKLSVYHEDSMIYQKNAYKDLYYRAFQDGLTFRDNCYKCQYAGINRVADLTIGDFWGLDKTTLKENYHGRVSVVLVNTQRGQELLENCSENVYFEERNVDEATTQNGQLKHPTDLHIDRKIFEENIAKGFTYAVNRTGIGREIRRIKMRESFPGKIWRKMKTTLS